MPTMPIAVTAIQSPESLVSFGDSSDAGVHVVLREPETIVICGPMVTIGDLAVGEAHAGVDTEVLVYWGLAGWTNTQLLGEIARGSWGMCRGSFEDLRMSHQAPGAIWGQLQESQRPIFAPQNEMQEPQEDDTLETH